MSISIDNLVAVLNDSNLPVTYYQWPLSDVPPLPYIVYWLPDSDNFFADNRNYKNISNVRIELYTEHKDFGTERNLEVLLENNEIPYEKSEQWLKSEEMWMIVYTTSIITD